MLTSAVGYGGIYLYIFFDGPRVDLKHTDPRTNKSPRFGASAFITIKPPRASRLAASCPV